MSNVNQTQNPFGNLFNAVGSAVTAGANAVGQAAATFVDEWTEDVEAVADGFEQHGLAGGALAILDAASFGNVVQNQLTAYGILPDDPVFENVAKAGLNLWTGNPIAVKNLIDTATSVAASHAESAPPSPTKSGPSFTPPAKGRGPVHSGPSACPPARAGTVPPPSAALPGYHLMPLPHRGYPVCPGHDDVVRPGCDPRDLIGRIGEHAAFARIEKLLEKILAALLEEAGVERTGPSVEGKPVKDTGIQDILNDPNLTFEDIVALVMMKVVSEEQEKIKGELSALEDAASLDGDAAKGGGAARTSAKGATGTSKGAAADGETIPGGPAKEMASSVIDGAKAMGPALIPLVTGALAAFPPIGTALAPFAPVLVPLLLEGADATLDSGVLDGLFAGGGNAPGAEEGGAPGEVEGGSKESRDIKFEKLKLAMNKLSQMQQTMSNVLNAHHETSMACIRNIR